MEILTKLKSGDLFKLDYQADDNSIWLTNSYTLKRLIGILGISLPLLLYIFLYIDSGYYKPLPSISHYYFTRVSSIFVIIVSLLAIFLIVYKGREPLEFYISIISGFFALFLILFPTGNLLDTSCGIANTYVVTILKENHGREIFHYISAGIFLFGLALMSFFLFPGTKKSTSARGKNKGVRNIIYKTCGIIMILAILVILAGFLNIIPDDFYDRNHLTFWMETIAIESFGISWLIKGNTFFKD